MKFKPAFCHITLLFSGLLLVISCSATSSLEKSSETNVSIDQQLQKKPRLVLTSVAPIFNITKTLLTDTNIEIENIPAKPRSLAAQATLFSRQAERYAKQFKAADAIITISKIWPEDSFYTTVREANIRIVNIDATKPWSHSFTGVSISTSPVTGKVSSYFWMTPTNTIRTLNIVARDLQTLYPDQAEIINKNLEQEKKAYIALKANFEERFIEVTDPVVYALADEFSYLTSELGIFIDDYFVKQDIDWTEQDLTNLTDHLRQSGIKVVIHKWEPSEAIQVAIKKANAQLVILDLMETGTKDMHITRMEMNLEKILHALVAANLTKKH